MMAARLASHRLATNPAPPPPQPTHSARCSIISLVAIAIIFGGSAIALGTCWFKGVPHIAAIGRNGAISTIAGGGTLIVALSLIAIYKGCEEDQEGIGPMPPSPPQPQVQTISQMLIEVFHSSYHLVSNSYFVREGVEVGLYDTLRQKYLIHEDPLFQQNIAPLIPNLQHLSYLCYSTPKEDRHFLFGKVILSSGQTVFWAITTQSREDNGCIKVALAHKGFAACNPVTLLNQH